MDATPPTSRRPEFGFFTEFSQAPGMSEATRPVSKPPPVTHRQARAPRA